MLNKSGKPLFPQLKKTFSSKKFGFFFLRKMTHSADNPKQSSILAKRFVSKKIEGASIKTNWEKVAMRPKNDGLKKNKIRTWRAGSLRIFKT